MEEIDFDDFIDELKQGSAKAQQILLEAFGPPLANYLKGACNLNDSEVEDFVADTLYKIILNMDTFKPQEGKTNGLWGWMTRIGRNLVVDQRRKKTVVTTSLEDEITTDKAYKPEDGEQTTDLQNIVISALKELPDNHRLTLMLHSMNGWALNEVAEYLNAKESTVRKWKQRGLAKLEAIMSEEPIIRERYAKYFAKNGEEYVNE